MYFCPVLFDLDQIKICKYYVVDKTCTNNFLAYSIGDWLIFQEIFTKSIKIC